MPKAMKICKVCGKEYEACHTPNPGVWRWRDVACCYEHGLQYLHDVQVARGEIVEDKVEPVTVEPEVNDVADDPMSMSAYQDFNVAESDEDAEIEPSVSVTQTTKRVRSRKK